MAKYLLPYVSAETAEAIRSEISIGPAEFLKKALEQLAEENPGVAINMQVWAHTQPDPEAALVGPGTMYALLRKQAEADRAKH